MCSVNGPMEVKIKDELIDKCSIDVVYKPSIGATSNLKFKNIEFI